MGIPEVIPIDWCEAPTAGLSPQMLKVFGTFGGKVSIQKSPPRWVEPKFVDETFKFVAELDCDMGSFAENTANL